MWAQPGDPHGPPPPSNMYAGEHFMGYQPQHGDALQQAVRSFSNQIAQQPGYGYQQPPAYHEPIPPYHHEPVYHVENPFGNSDPRYVQGYPIQPVGQDYRPLMEQNRGTSGYTERSYSHESRAGSSRPGGMDGGGANIHRGPSHERGRDSRRERDSNGNRDTDVRRTGSHTNITHRSEYHSSQQQSGERLRDLSFSGSSGGGHKGHASGKHHQLQQHQHQQHQHQQHAKSSSGRSHSPPRRRTEQLPYASHLRPYSVTTSAWDSLGLRVNHPELPLSPELVGIKVHWPHTVPHTPLRQEPTIPINLSAPVAVDNSAVPATPSSNFNFPSPIDPSRPIRTQVRVMLLRGAPIDISAPKSGIVHISSNILFLLLERKREKGDSLLFPLGGEYDPSQDGGQPSSTCTIDDTLKVSDLPDDEHLIRTAVRTVKAQIGLDLSLCSRWYRFLDLEYAREGSTSINDRIVYFIPSSWELLSSPDSFSDLWIEWKKEEYRNAARREIDMLSKQLSSIKNVQSAVYIDLSNRLLQQEQLLKDDAQLLSPNDTPPARPQLLTRTNPQATNDCHAGVYSLRQLLTYQGVPERNDEFLDLALFGETFNDFLQFYLGMGIFDVISQIRMATLPSAKPIILEERLAAALNSSRKRARSLPDTEDEFTDALTSKRPKLEEPNQIDTMTGPVTPVHIKQEDTSTSSMPESSGQDLPKKSTKPEDDAALTDTESDYSDQGVPTETNSTAPIVENRADSIDTSFVQQTPSTEGLHESSKSQDDQSGARQQSANNSRLESDQKLKSSSFLPERRDYELMQAFRFFDLNRLGFMHAEDIETLMLSLGLGISRSIAAQLAHNCDRSPPSKNSNLSSDGKKIIRYKPICDWETD